MPTHINNNKNAEIDMEIENEFLFQAHLSSVQDSDRQVHFNLNTLRKAIRSPTWDLDTICLG